MLSTLFGSEIKNNNKITSISSTSIIENNDIKKINTLKLLFESNLNKILICGDWKIKDNGKTLVRMINGKESELVSYMSIYIVDKFIYYLMNGQIFIATLEISDNKLKVCLSNTITSNMVYESFVDYKWVNI
jgi:hypothetical protein